MPLHGKNVLLVAKVRPQKREKVMQAISQIVYFLQSLQGLQRTWQMWGKLDVDEWQNFSVEPLTANVNHFTYA